jgi:hypothetical protein
MKQHEWRGREVTLLRDMRTKGGTEFKAGEVLVSSSAYRGKLNLHDPKTPRNAQGGLRSIGRVRIDDVRLMPKEEKAPC